MSSYDKNVRLPDPIRARTLRAHTLRIYCRLPESDSNYWSRLRLESLYMSFCLYTE